MIRIICGQGIFALVSSVKPVDKGDQHRKVWEQRPALSAFHRGLGLPKRRKIDTLLVSAFGGGRGRNGSGSRGERFLCKGFSFLGGPLGI